MRASQAAFDDDDDDDDDWRRVAFSNAWRRTLRFKIVHVFIFTVVTVQTGIVHKQEIGDVTLVRRQLIQRHDDVGTHPVCAIQATRGAFFPVKVNLRHSTVPKITSPTKPTVSFLTNQLSGFSLHRCKSYNIQIWPRFLNYGTVFVIGDWTRRLSTARGSLFWSGRSNN